MILCRDTLDSYLPIGRDGAKLTFSERDHRLRRSFPPAEPVRGPVQYLSGIVSNICALRTKHCWQNYVDYYKCVEAKGEDFRPCKQVLLASTTTRPPQTLIHVQFYHAFRSLCPKAWTDRWDGQRGTCSSPGKFDVRMLIESQRPATSPLTLTGKSTSDRFVLVNWAISNFVY
jgi:cytochrome c oxidase subunit 6b